MRPSALALGALACMLHAVLSSPGAWAGEAGPAKSGWPPEGTKVLDRIVAVVNTDPVTWFELMLKAAPFEARLRSKGGLGLDKALLALRAQVLDSLINDILIRSEARKMRLEVTQEQIDAHLTQIKTSNSWDDDDLLEAVKQIGFESLADYRRNVQRELLKQQAIGYRVRALVKINPQEAQKRLETNLKAEGGGIEERRAAHIMFKVPEFSTDKEIEARLAKLREIRRVAMAGDTTFEELARQHSHDTNAGSGGDLGWLTRGDTDPDFEKVVWGLPLNQVSAPVRTDFGFHLIKVTGIRKKNVLTDKKRESMLRQIRYRMRQEEAARLLEIWMVELRQNVFIEVKDEPLKPLVKSLQGQKRSSPKPTSR